MTIESDEPPLFPPPLPPAAPPIPSKSPASRGKIEATGKGGVDSVVSVTTDHATEKDDEEPLAMVEESELGLVIGRELKNTYAPLEMWYLRSTIEKVSSGRGSIGKFDRN